MDRLPNDLWSDPGLDGKYLFEQHIAASAMAVVVVARHLDLDERVAIKFLSPDALRSSAAVSRFRREAKTAAKIKNQHVVRIIDVATTISGIPYIVMEFLDGKDLERLLAQYPNHQAPIVEAIDFVLQASEAIIEGHALGIVHRDLKPANLFCVDRGDGYPMIKVLDFGISKFAASVGEVERTDRHEILGSPRYMSPEQIEAACNVDHRTDIWALGTILYEAIGGRAPFNEDLIPELWRKIRHEAPEALPTLRRDCPLELWEIIAKCLQKDPANRYDDLGQLAEALAPMAPERSRGSVGRIRWTADANGPETTRALAVSDSYDRVVTTPHRNRLRWVIAGGIAFIFGIGLSVVAIRQPPKPERPPSSERDSNLRAVEHATQSKLHDNAVDVAASSIDLGSTNISAAVTTASAEMVATHLPVPKLQPSQRVGDHGSRRSNNRLAPPKQTTPVELPSASPPGVSGQSNKLPFLLDPVVDWK